MGHYNNGSIKSSHEVLDKKTNHIDFEKSLCAQLHGLPRGPGVGLPSLRRTCRKRTLRPWDRPKGLRLSKWRTLIGNRSYADGVHGVRAVRADHASFGRSCAAEHVLVPLQRGRRRSIPASGGPHGGSRLSRKTQHQTVAERAERRPVRWTVAVGFRLRRPKHNVPHRTRHLSHGQS